MTWMPCECPYEAHRFTLFPGPAHWPGERFFVRHAVQLFTGETGSGPNRHQLVCVIYALLEAGDLTVAETMLDNAINFGTVHLLGDDTFAVGNSVPLRLVRPPFT